MPEQTIPPKCCGLASDIFTLFVGPEQEKFRVQRDILTKIPYFTQSLRSDGFIESKKRAFNLDELEPDVLSKVLYFVQIDSVPAIQTQKDEVDRHLEESQVMLYIKAYMTADRLMIKDIQNNILQQIVKYHQVRSVKPQEIAMLSRKDYDESALYCFLVSELAWKFADRVKTSMSAFAWQAIGVSLKGIAQDEESLSRLDLCSLLWAIDAMMKESEPALSKFWLSGPEVEDHEDILAASIKKVKPKWQPEGILIGT